MSLLKVYLKPFDRSLKLLGKMERLLISIWNNLSTKISLLICSCGAVMKSISLLDLLCKHIYEVGTKMPNELLNGPRVQEERSLCGSSKARTGTMKQSTLKKWVGQYLSGEEKLTQTHVLNGWLPSSSNQLPLILLKAESS